MSVRSLPISWRWIATFALAFIAFAVGAFGELFWSTTQIESNRIDSAALRELDIVAHLPERSAVARINALLQFDQHRTRFAAIFDARGRRVAGNIARVPAGLAPDGRIHETAGIRQDERGRVDETMRAGARRLADGRIVVIGQDLDARDQTRADLRNAILAGVYPALAVALALGAAFGIASQRRVRTIEAAIDRIVAGNFTARLPIRSGRGDIDRIALGVNRMLDAIETLYEDVRGVGDDMAHDLRTPLGRVRAQLERGRENAASATEYQAVIDRAIAGVDQALAVIIALLRIGQIEHRERRSGFSRVDLGALARDVADLYAPVAEDAHVTLVIEDGVHAAIAGDRDLLFEAFANLVDNAIKFGPQDGHVAIGTATVMGVPAMTVTDDGPGIPPDERAIVVRRFTRGDKSRHVIGNGLGLSLVTAIVRLHEAALSIEDGEPGCVIRISFPQAALVRATNTYAAASPHPALPFSNARAREG